MKGLLILLICFISTAVFSQEYILAHRNTATGTQLKWYGPELIPTQEYYIFRKEEGGEWQKLNATPLSKGRIRPSATEMQKDKELADYLKLTDGNKKPEGIAQLLITLKTFESNAFCSYLGMYYEDNNVPAGKYQYKLAANVNGTMKDLKVTELFDRSPGQNMQPVDSLGFKLIKAGVKLKWKTEKDRFYGVVIYRSESPDSLGKKITDEPVLLSKIKNEKGEMVFPDYYFADEKLEEKKTYYYTFAGINFFNEELEYTRPLKIRIKDETRPSAPENLTKVVYDKKVVLKWEHLVRDEDQIGYHLHLTKNNDTIFTVVDTIIIPVTAKTYEFTSFGYGTFGIRIASFDEDGNEGFSNALYAEILDKIPPAPPANVHIVADTGRLVVQWDKNSESDILGYKIYRSIKGNKSALTLLTSEHFTENSFTDSLPGNAINSFTYTVIALDSNQNESKPSEPATQNMIDVTPPKPPFLKSVNLDQEKVIISWVKNTELDLAGYMVERFDLADSVSGYQQLNIKNIPADVGEFVDRYVGKGHQYAYRIFAVDKQNNISASSNEMKFEWRERKEKKGPDFKNASAKYVKSAGAVKLKWTTSSADPDLSFVVFKKEGELLKPVTAMQKGEQFTDKNISRGETVEYQVRAYDTMGKTSKSEIIKIVIPKNKK